MNIVVLAGGLSPERDVSLSSAALIANSLIRSGNRVALIDIYFDLPDDYQPNFSCVPDFEYTISEHEPDLDAIIRANNNSVSLIGKNVLKQCEAADVSFIALHGSMGENGQLQATLDNYGIRYTGSGFIGCLLSMDKDISKRLMRDAGIKTAEWRLYDAADCDPSSVIRDIGMPCVVKPCSCGSSVGISIVNNESELATALSLAFKYEKTLLIERMIPGREFSVGILNGAALPPIEIIPLKGFYDYKNKYQNGLTREICPADLSDKQTSDLQRAAMSVHKILRLGSYSRIDFIMDRVSGEFICLEANALPGMTPLSLLPREAAAAGIDYDSLCEIIVSAACNRTE
ncbi:MAG: D-alanine--D-alanine ligase [Eubacteriales bacterium]|jgi:D-alanine-D-alanine ligase|nr:D-alanine--D-alanine ligase [Eubacteriales bacterium]